MTSKRTLALATAMALIATPAFAHPGHVGEGLVAGFAHPLSGLDHVTVMIAVGLLAAQLGGRALWALPSAFLGTMILGGALGMAGVQVPLVETGIAISVVVMLGIVVLRLKPDWKIATAMVAAFALLHGHAHGSEMPLSDSGLAFGAGFVAATAALHALGLGFGLALQRLRLAFLT